MAKKEFPSDKLDQYIVRFPDGMRDRIKDAAAANNRSMNAEIIARLETSFRRSITMSEEQISEILNALKEGIERQAGQPRHANENNNENG